MRILICSLKADLLESLRDNTGWEVIIQKDVPVDDIAFDAAYMDQQLQDCRKDCREVLQKLKLILPVPWGLLDFQKKVKDPISLIFHGWSDYLGGKDLISRLDPLRLENVLYYDTNRKPLPLKTGKGIEGYPSGDDWTGVEEGKEYLFGMLYLEALPTKHLEAQLGEQGINRLQSEWRNLLMEFFDPWYGYLWINNGWSSVMLFPFNGQSFHVIEGALEFLLNQTIFRFTTYQGKLEYRQVLHLANAPFHKRNNTSNLISESLNDLFHMGMYHAEAGRLHITEEVRKFVPESLNSYVLEPEMFEGHRIFPFRKCR